MQHQVSWEIVNAHKGSVTSMYVDHQYIITGGQDGQVRLWGRKNRQFIT